MKNEFLIAITQLSAEKNLPKEVVLEAVEAALLSAYKKDSPAAAGQNVSVRISPATGEPKFVIKKTVAETVADPQKEISLKDARKLQKDVAFGETVDIEITPPNAGRIAAQTAKQVVMQRLREAEREVVFEEFADKEGDIVSGIVQRIDPKQITIDLGRAEAMLPASEQVKSEHYRMGQRLKLYLMEVRRTNKGPQVIVSRTHRNLLRRLFEREVPEIFSGAVEIKSIAREAGYRSKAAVYSRQEGVDPVGCCVGLRGIRIQNIVNELGGERIDVVQWHPDPKAYVANALSPAQVVSVEIDSDEKTAIVVVPDRQLSLAIGKEGQNARLAAKLTGLRIDIKSASIAESEKAERAEKAALRQAEEVAAAAERAAAAAEAAAPEEAALLPQAEEAPVVEAAAGLEGAPEAPEMPVTAPEAPLVPVGAIEFSIPEAEEELAAKPKIRFAEDLVIPGIAVEARPGAKGKKAKHEKRGAAAEVLEREGPGRPKKKGRRPSLYPTDEDEDEFLYLKKPGRRD
ncbi:MAG: transcription termination/antitermination protein NusA [Chloroflexi bacterium]|nr:transcription termination/antitermination protein NusA [Chloroflexota bacterium]